jgi:hypothetical protein
MGQSWLPWLFREDCPEHSILGNFTTFVGVNSNFPRLYLCVA